MKNQLSTLILCVAVALMFALEAQAQTSDIQIFGAAGATPNIAIVLDSSGSMNNPPSWSICGSGDDDDDDDGCPTKFEIAIDAYRGLVGDVNPPDGVGGYVENARFGLFKFAGSETLPRAELLVPIADNKTADVLTFAPTITTWTPLSVVLTDVVRYFAGSLGWGTLPKYGALASEPAQPSPIDLYCRENFVIFLSDGQPTRDNHDKYPAAEHCATIGDADGDGAEGGICDTFGNMDRMDDVAHAAYRSDFSALIGDQNITTYTIGFDLNIPILEDAAIHGGGSYFEVRNSGEITEAFRVATQQIFESLVSFTAGTVPSSRKSFSDAFYTAYFEALTSEPFWPGHLQAYRFTGAGDVIDANGNVAIDPLTDEFIEPRAPFWDVAERLTDPSHPTRKIYTTLGGIRTAFDKATVAETDMGLVAADLDQYATAAPYGSTTALRDDIVDFLFGHDVYDVDIDTDTAELRDAVLGDIFHSNPKIVGAPPPALGHEQGYGPSTDPGTFLEQFQYRDRRLYVGANDGMLHGINAGSYQAGDNPVTVGEIENGYYDEGSGNEEFGWVPGMLLDTIKYVPINAPRTHYYVDGSPAAADAWFHSSITDTVKSGNEWTTVLMTPMRQGGAGYLSLDVTDPQATSGNHGPYPKLLWEFDSSGGEPLGEAWSSPVITRIKIKAGSGFGDNCGQDDGDGDCREQWVGIFAGGYLLEGDPNFGTYVATSNPSWSIDSKSIFVIDIQTGAVLAKLAHDPADSQLQKMVYSIPTNPAVIDLDFDGFADLIYFGDLGGQMWKWDLSLVGEDTDSDGLLDNWPYGVLFESIPVNIAGSFHYRSIFTPPAVSLVNGDVVLSFGTGERTDMRYAGNVAFDDNNRFYVVRDPAPHGAASVPAAPYTEAHLDDVTSLALDPDPLNLGFYIVAEDGEKFMSNSIVLGGFLISTSFSPTSSGIACEALQGQSFLYVFDLEFGGSFFTPGPDTSAQGRRLALGSGVAGDPQITVGPDGTSRIVIQRSNGAVDSIEGPGAGDDGTFMVYWKQEV